MVKNNTGANYTYTTNAVSVYDPFKFIDQIWDSNWGTSVTSWSPAETYPPYNIREIDEDTRVLELALAGFSKDEIKVELENRQLTITGEKAKTDEEVKYIHKGIATRKFTKSVTLWEYWEVESADYNDGVLYVVLKREIPEEKKPRQIKIK
jgi:molecular chaperone IbpA